VLDLPGLGPKGDIVDWAADGGTREGLDELIERPELRKFNADPCTLAREDRGKYVVAGLAIIRAYMLSGAKPQAEPINNYARYCASDPRSVVVARLPGSVRDDGNRQNARHDARRKKANRPTMENRRPLAQSGRRCCASERK